MPCEWKLLLPIPVHPMSKKFASSWDLHPIIAGLYHVLPIDIMELPVTKKGNGYARLVHEVALSLSNT